MSSVIRSLVVRVGADLTNFNQATKAISKDLGKMSRQYDKIGQSLTNNITKPILAVGAGIGALVVSGIKDAVEAEKYVAQLDAVLKSTGQTAGVTREQALGLADAFEKNTKFAAEDTLAAENMLLTFTNIGKNAFPQATEMCLDMATAFGTEASASAIQLGKALNDPTKGITALTRVGVTFTDEQKKQIKTLQESGDMYGAQMVVLKELQREFGGSAKAAGKTFAGQMEITKNMIGAVKEEIGVALMPVLQDLMKQIQDNMPKIQKAIEGAIPIIKNDIVPVLIDLGKTVGNVIEWFAGLSPETQKTIGKMILFGAALGPVLSGVSGILGMASNFTGFLSSVTKLAGVSSTAGAAGSMARFGASIAAMVGPAGWITLAIAGLSALCWYLKKTADEAEDDTLTYKGEDVDHLHGRNGRRYETPTKIVGGGTQNGDFVKGAKPFANGGIVTRPTLGLLGEAGAEAVIPLGKGLSVNHTGTITVRGVNNRDELVAVVEQQITNNLIKDNRRMPNRTSLVPIG